MAHPSLCVPFVWQMSILLNVHIKEQNRCVFLRDVSRVRAHSAHVYNKSVGQTARRRGGTNAETHKRILYKNKSCDAKEYAMREKTSLWARTDPNSRFAARPRSGRLRTISWCMKRLKRQQEKKTSHTMPSRKAIIFPSLYTVCTMVYILCISICREKAISHATCWETVGSGKKCKKNRGNQFAQAWRRARVCGKWEAASAHMRDVGCESNCGGCNKFY